MAKMVVLMDIMVEMEILEEGKLQDTLSLYHPNAEQAQLVVPM